MKKLLLFAALLAAGYYGYRHFSATNKPSASDVETALKAFLAAGKGQCTVTHLSEVSVGNFVEQFGGWPVYASHQETCQDGDTSTTYDGLGDASKRVAAAFARVDSAGAVELYVPQLFQDAQQRMSQEVQQQLKQTLDQVNSK